MPLPEGPLASGVPADVTHDELRAWTEGRAGLDRVSRLRRARVCVAALRMRSAHHKEQLQAAQEELRDLGDLAAPPAQRLRIREGGHELQQTDLALAHAERRLEDLQGVQR